MATEDYEVLGQIIKGRRKRLMLTQQEVADIIGMSKGEISRIENGHHRPYPSTIRKIATALDSDFNDFVRWTPTAPPEDRELTEENEAGLEAARRRKTEIDAEILREGDASGSGDRTP